MEKGYKNVVFFFVTIIAIILIGFSKTYFVLFPSFEGLKALHHIHGFTLGLFLIMFIIQPILISKKKYKWHRAVGKFSYFLVPFIIITMLLVYKNMYLRSESIGDPHAQNLGFLFLPFTDILPFAIYYVLAIINKNNTAKHLRYMISTAVLLVGPGVIRIFVEWVGLDFMPAIIVTSVSILFVFAGLILYDQSKNKQFIINPFTIASLIFLIPNVLFLFVPNTSFWQTFAEGMVETFF